MICRVWKTNVDPARLEDYEAFARERSLPMFRAHDGFRGVALYRRGAACFVATYWRSKADIETLEASPLYRGTVEAILASGFLSGPQETETFAVQMTDFSPLCQGGGT